MSNPVEYPTKYKISFYIIFLFLGWINNIGYTLIITSSQQWSKKLDVPELVGFYPFASIWCSSLSRIWNSRFCLKLRYSTRITMISFYFFSGYISLFIILQIVEHDDTFNKKFAFCLTMIPSLIMGTGSAFGEANLLGYLRTFPKDYVSGWASGTGCAGISGASISLWFKIFDIKTKYLYLFISPITWIYWGLFYLSMLLKLKADSQGAIRLSEVNKIDFEKIQTNPNEKPQDEGVDININHNNNNNNSSSNSNCNADSTQKVHAEEASGVQSNRAMSFHNFKEAFPLGKRYIINLALVYYLEYIIYTGLSERVSDYKYVENEYIGKYWYESFCLCYQIGVLISRSSLWLVQKNPFVELYTICQLLNLILWLIEAQTGFITTWWIWFLLLICVGLLGGASYVGCFYFLWNSPRIESNWKELCINIGTIFNDLGVLSSCITVLILDMTIFKSNNNNNNNKNI